MQIYLLCLMSIAYPHSLRRITSSVKNMFAPENNLEESLCKAADDPSHRLQFYKDLIASDIYLIQDGLIPETAGVKTLKQGTQLQIEPMEIDGKKYLPIFSSITRLQMAIKEEVGYLAINALEFFKITRGAELILNPGMDYGKEFLSQEIESIISGEIFRPQESWTARENTQVLIGQPSNYPTDLAESLKRFFKSQRSVKKAYLVHFYNPTRDDKPHTLIGVESNGNWDEIVAGAGMVAEGVEIPDPPVDFLQIEGKDQENYFSGTKPFYQRKKFGIF